MRHSITIFWESETPVTLGPGSPGDETLRAMATKGAVMFIQNHLDRDAKSVRIVALG